MIKQILSLLIASITSLSYGQDFQQIRGWNILSDSYADDIETINLDNPAFWEWFKQDYRDMLKLVPGVDGLVLTFIETGARAENQYSEELKTGSEKLAAVVDAVAGVICDELGKKLYIRTFAYTDAEYKNTIGCIDHIKSNKIILMMKETPHDFFLTHPNDKYAGTINRPTIMEFDACNEFNGQGVIANTWPEYILKRWSDLIRRPNIIGYVARTDRYGDTRLVGTPNEILLYALKRYTEDQTVTADKIYYEFISEKYGYKAVRFLKPAFMKAFDIISSSIYTLGTNIANHSKLDYDPYKSSYGRHVSGKWIDPPVVFVRHGVNKEFHYWTDIIEHLAPARFKTPEAGLNVEAPVVIKNNWVTPVEKMDETYLKYIIAEKHFGVKSAEKAFRLAGKAEPFLNENDSHLIMNLFYRTLLTAKVYEATATAYFGYRVYARGEEYQTKWLKKTLKRALDSMLIIAGEIDSYKEKVPRGQWNWRGDATTAREYHKKITETGWKEYGNVVFKLSYPPGPPLGGLKSVLLSPYYGHNLAPL
ncbi:MAG: hypothetical protein MUO72_08250 [Bacteroidales bacterium]|nr:hypothetical protein [Bacteroidales bacterium]